jgi:two-component system, NarL family, nitrate/nitrite response regulator NarL
MNATDRPSDSLPPPLRSRAARVVIADDEGMFRASLRQLLSVPASVVRDVYGVDVGAGFEVVAEAASGEDAVEAVRSTQPDLLLLDVCMPRLSGLEALREVAVAAERTRTIILSGGLDKSQLLAAVKLGARAVVLKEYATELLFEAMIRVQGGESWVGQGLVTDLMDAVRTLACQPATARQQPFGLTRREREVLSLVVAGCANKEIAQRFAVSEETIKHHLTRMFDKVGATNRLELALTATRHGLVN